VSASDVWLAEAAGWAAWARQGDDDGFADFRALLPPPGRATLDLGCGEGRFARSLAAEGHRVTGADISPDLVELAKAADADGTYVVADAEALPFPDSAFDLVVAFNVLGCVANLERAVREATRVLEPGGRLCLSVVHPVYTAGRAEGGAWVVEGGYLEERLHAERVRRGEAELTFANVHRPLGAYTAAFERCGLELEALREPAWQLVPMFLYLRGRKT
jgi:ubiquinone/menaquinone biosynthesis C-methylase UbiE